MEKYNPYDVAVYSTLLFERFCCFAGTAPFPDSGRLPSGAKEVTRFSCLNSQDVAAGTSVVFGLWINVYCYFALFFRASGFYVHLEAKSLGGFTLLKNTLARFLSTSFPFYFFF